MCYVRVILPYITPAVESLEPRQRLATSPAATITTLHPDTLIPYSECAQCARDWHTSCPPRSVRATISRDCVNRMRLYETSGQFTLLRWVDHFQLSADAEMTDLVPILKSLAIENAHSDEGNEADDEKELLPGAKSYRSGKTDSSVFDAFDVGDLRDAMGVLRLTKRGPSGYSSRKGRIIKELSTDRSLTGKVRSRHGESRRYFGARRGRTKPL